MTAFLSRLLKNFLSLHPMVQFVWGLTIAITIAGTAVVLVVVATNPTSVGAITSLMTTVVLLIRSGGHPSAAHLPPR